MSEWDDVADIQTDAVKIHDAQQGPEYIMRKFEYSFHPAIINGQQRKPNKKELLTEGYIKYLENALWGDALEIVPPEKGFPNPRVVIDKKGFTVVVVCKPKRGNIILDRDRDQLAQPLHKRLIENEPQ